MKNISEEPDSIKITIPLEPVAFARSGGGKTVDRFTPPKQRKFMHMVKKIIALKYRGLPLKGALNASFIFYIKKPKHPKHPVYPITRPDGDNYQKLISDSANGLLYEDDAQIVTWSGAKLFGVPRIEFTVTKLDSSRVPTTMRVPD